MKDLSNYPICLTKTSNDGVILFEAFYPDLTYVEWRGFGTTIELALGRLESAKIKMLEIYEKVNRPIPDPDPEITDVNSIKELLKYLYTGVQYNSFIIHPGGQSA